MQFLFLNLRAKNNRKNENTKKEKPSDFSFLSTFNKK
ncbi:hypothetical protein PI23P_03287 [Polaribacter irgensii 23-P]|uniref:Uncharacterized protein n=1 Tax=Polaribacter irgensii 23-P TaxID=313594 RepID=A4BWZ4_9FLAO|nr:hypothetical protein PI23P_03287 [Polaribacter irgensii 23-P]